MIEKIKYCHVQFNPDKSFVFDHVHIVWNRHIPFHQHAEWQITYMIKGSGTRIIADVVESFYSGEVVLVPANLPHCWAYDKNDLDPAGKVENITIVFPELLLEKLMATFPEMKNNLTKVSQIRNAIKFEGDTLQSLQKIIIAMKTQDDMEQMSSLIRVFHIIATSDKTRVVGHNNSKREKTREKLLDVLRYMVNNSERRISLDDVAKYTGMNRSSFCTFFRREKGKSFFTVLNEYRIDCACLILRETNLSITEICFEVGFEDVPYFNRTFKKLMKESPGEYRTKHRQKSLAKPMLSLLQI